MQRGSGFRADVQGLRGVAVALVALHHAGWDALPGGYVGVDVFFVLSGFLITGLLLQEAERAGRPSLRAFYARRARRLLPAAVLVLGATAVAARALLDPVSARTVLVDTVWAGLFAANLRFGLAGTDYFARDLPPSPLQHYWSLAVEEQFYLAWPVLLALALLVSGRRVRRGLLAALLAGLVAASFTWCLLLTAADPTAAYFSSPARAWELGLGALVAVGAPLLARLPVALCGLLSWAGLAAVLLAAARLDEETAFPGAAALLPVVGTALLLACSGRSGRGAETVLARRPLVGLGDVSYAFYLWHWPFLVLGAAAASRALAPGEGLLLLAAALLAAVLSTRLLEEPVRRSRLLHRRPGVALALWPATAGGALALAALLALTAVPAPPAPPPVAAPAPSAAPTAREAPPLPAVLASVAAAGQPLPEDLVPDPSRLRSDTSSLPYDCLAHEEDVRSRLCVTGDRGAGRTVVLLGDSHAFMWLPALQRLGREQGWRVVVVMKFACTVADLTIRNGTPSDTTCDAWREWALEEVAALAPDLVVATGQPPHTVLLDGQAVQDPQRLPALWGRAWGRTVDRLVPHAGRVVVLADVPGLAVDPLDCVARPQSTRGDCTYRPRPGVDAMNAAVEQAVRGTGAQWVPTRSWFCAGERCPAVVGSTVAYRDTGHTTATYAAQLWRVLAAALQPPDDGAPRPAVQDGVRREVREG